MLLRFVFGFSELRRCDGRYGRPFQISQDRNSKHVWITLGNQNTGHTLDLPALLFMLKDNVYYCRGLRASFASPCPSFGSIKGNSRFLWWFQANFCVAYSVSSDSILQNLVKSITRRLGTKSCFSLIDVTSLHVTFTVSTLLSDVKKFVEQL